MPNDRTGGDLLVSALKDRGVTTVFGIPGTHNLGIYAALAARGVGHVLPRHEQGAAFAADGWARVTGEVGVCLTTTGPGVLNAATALAQSYSDSIPVLVVSPGMPVGHPVTGNGELHEVKNQTAALAAVVARSFRVGSVAEIPLAVAQAYAVLTGGRPRPVHLEIPYDLIDETAAVEPVPPVPIGVPRPDVRQLDHAAGLLDRARRPMIVAGGGCAHAADEVRLIAERLDAPVVMTANGKGTVRSDHPLAVGTGVHHEAVRELADGSDVVIALGTELAPADLWSGPWKGTAAVIRVDIDPLAVTVNAKPAAALVTDVAVAVRALLGRAASRDRGGPARAAAARAKLDQDAQTEGAAYSGLCRALTAVLGERGILCGDSTMACYYGALSGVPAFRPRSFLYPAGLGTLGYGLPAAIGAKLARPDDPVVALHGDGGFMFTMPEFATAVELGLALPVVVVDNGGYGEIRHQMAERGDPRQAVDFRAPDFAALGRALGGHGVRIGAGAELEPALSAALSAHGPTLVHLPEEAAR